MRTLLLTLGALLVVLGVFSTKLWRNLQAERLANAGLSTQLATAGTASGVPASPTQSIPVPPPAAAQDCPALATAPAPAAAPVTSFLVTMGHTTNSNAEKDLWKDPEYRSAQLTTTRMMLVASHPGLAETLGLSDAEASHLFDVMAEKQLKLLRPLFTGDTAAGASDGATALTAEELRVSAAGGNVIRVTLGEARNELYEDYLRNGRPVLGQMASLANTLTSAGQPMSDSQSRALTAALLADQRQRPQQTGPRLTANPGPPRGTVERLEVDNRRRDDTDRRILAAAASSLSPAQQQELRAHFDQQAATRRRTLETAREILNARP